MKKGQLQVLSGLAVGIASLAIALVVCFLILSQGRTQSIVTGTQDFTLIEDAAQSFTGAYISSPTIAVTETSSGDPVPTDEYTVADVAGYASTIELAGDGITNWNNTELTTNYDTHPVGYQATETLTSAVGAIPGWIALIVIAVVGGVLIGLVSYFRR